MLAYTISRSRTKSYKSVYNEPCNCIYCLNFRKAFPSFCPEANALLEDFGLSVDTALEIIENGSHDYETIDYEAYFCVAGTLSIDGYSVPVPGNAAVKLFKPTTKEPIYKNTDMPEPYYILRVAVSLPWVLDARPQQHISAT